MGLFANIRRRTLVSYLAIVGALLHAALFVLHSPVLAGANITAGGPGTTTIVICSAQGLKRITIDSEGNRVGEPEPASHQDNCLSCTTCCTGTSALPSADIVPWLAVHPNAPTTPQLHNLVESQHILCRKSRGPPLPA
ncbi:MAG: DUF2946 family protein [Methyloligellaceae bacterium]